MSVTKDEEYWRKFLMELMPIGLGGDASLGISGMLCTFEPSETKFYISHSDDKQERKPKFRLENYYHRTVMYVSSKQQLEIFVQVLHNAGLCWSSGKSYLAEHLVSTAWEAYGSTQLCINFNDGYYGSYGYYEQQGYHILEFDDFDWSDDECLVESKPKPMTLEELDKLLEEERRQS